MLLKALGSWKTHVKILFPGINKILDNKTLTFIATVIKLLMWNNFGRDIAEMGRSK